ncbi:MAG: sulfotransferase [Phycisphaerales bacterium]|nr:sulfotransferase [Phycisphaerales bacterium]
MKNRTSAVFVTGCGRSGTTALRTALSSHPNLLSTGTENNIVGDLLQTCDLNATVESRRISLQLSEDSYESLFAQLIQDLIFPNSFENDDSLRPMFATWITPESAQRALKLFPKSQVVLIVRDGIATVESRLAHHSFGKLSFESHCQKWASWTLLYEWAHDRDDCMIVRHQDLVTEAEATINSVIEFLDLPSSAEPARILNQNQFHPTPADSRPVWQNWSEHDREIFVEICGQAMESLGYPIVWKSASIS